MSDFSYDTELYRLSDLIHDKEKEPEYFGQFGFEHIEISDNHPITKEAWERICLRINEAYYDRFLAGETLEQWQRRIQVISDRTIPRYERRFRLYQNNRNKLEKDLGYTQETEYENVKDSSINKSHGRVADTPDSAINENENYAGTVSSSLSGSENVKTGKVYNRMTGRNGILELIEENMALWRDVETDLVDEFGKAFLNLIWY